MQHGLGFLSGQVSWYTFYPQYVNSYNVFEPQIIFDNGKVARYAPVYVFDTFLVNNQTSKFLFADIQASHNDFIPGSAVQDFFNSYPTTKSYTRANAIYNAVVSGGIIFQAKGIMGIPLYCPKSYIYGSSISHLDYSNYANSPDFSMTYNIGVYRGKTIDSVIKLNAKMGESYGVYGPAVLNIMKSLGWGSAFESDSNGLVGTFVKDSSTSGSKSYAFTAGIITTFIYVLIK